MQRGVAFAFVLAGCTHGASTVQQAGTVPAPRAMLYDGQPLDGAARVEGRLRTVTQETEPLEASSGSYVSRTHSQVSARAGVADTDIGVDLDLGWTAGSQPASSGLGERPEYDFAMTFTGSLRHSINLGEGIRVGLGVESGFTSSPIRINGGRTEYDEAPIFGIAFVPSWRSGPLTLFAGFHAVTETTVPRSVISESQFDVPEVVADGGTITWNAGATFSTGGGFRVTAAVAQPTAAEHANHGLQIDVAIGFDIGSKPRIGRRAQQPQVIYAPPAAYPPPPPPQPYPAPPSGPVPPPAPAPQPTNPY